MRLPWSLAIVGIPRGWSDENQWYWTGYMWKQRPWRNIASLNEWLLGASPPALGLVGFDAANPDDSDRYVFSRSGEPGPIGLWFVRRSWLVAICSGATLVLGFVAIFSRIRFRTVWMLCAVAGLLAAVQFQPSVTFLALQSSVIGVLFLLLGLLIERMIERSRWPSLPTGRGSSPNGRIAADSSLNRSAGVGSDDSTAIRARVPSTLDHVPAPKGTAHLPEDARSSTVERA